MTYRRIAWFYDLLDLPFEHGRYRDLRPQLWAGLDGNLLDAGVGTGRNIAYYPPGARVTGIDISPHMLARAEKRARRQDRAVTLREMDVTRTDFPDRHFDACVATFLFCVLDDALQLPALAELGRIVKPDGEIRLVEYVLSEDPRRRRIQHLWAPWVERLYEARFDRDTEQYVEAAGLRLAEARFLYADIIKLLVLKPA